MPAKQTTSRGGGRATPKPRPPPSGGAAAGAVAVPATADHSPLLVQFLSYDLWGNSKGEDLRRESGLIDRLCLVAAIHRYFVVLGAGKLKEKTEGASPVLAQAVEEFYARYKDHFNSAGCSYVDGVFCVPHVRPATLDRMSDFGRQCACRQVYPFSVTDRTYDAETVKAVVRGFEPVYLRLLQLWSGPSEGRYVSRTLNLLCNELMLAWPPSFQDVEEVQGCAELCRNVAGLAIESMALRIYMEDFLSLSVARRHGALNPVMRELFWAIAFLYARIDPRWDAAGGVGAGAIEAYIARTDGLRRQLMGVLVAAVERVHLTDESVSGLRRYMAELSSPQEKGVVQGAIDAMLGCGVSRFYPTPRDVQELNVHLLQAEVLMELGETPVTVSVSPMDYRRCLAPPLAAAAEAVQNPQGQMRAASMIDVSMNAVIRQTGDAAPSTATDDVLLDEYGQIEETVSVLEVEEGVAPPDEVVPSSGADPSSCAAASPPSPESKRLTQSQRRRLAKKRGDEERAAECAALLDDLCGLVARDAAGDMVRLEEQRREATQALAQELLAEEAEAFLREAAEAALKDAREEEGLKAQRLVLQQLKDGTLPKEFKCRMLLAFADGFHKFLQGPWECQFCLEDLDLETSKPVRYLACCGGIFYCKRCFTAEKYIKHWKDQDLPPAAGQHVLQVEETPVKQAEAARAAYGWIV